MDDIYLANDEIIKFNLREIKSRSFIILGLIYPIMSTVGQRTVIYYSLKLILSSMILREECLSKKDAYDECRKYIPYEFLDYKLFNTMFYLMKNYAESGLGFEKISGENSYHLVSRIFWPKKIEDQNKVKNKLLNFELSFYKKRKILPKDKIFSSEMRIEICKILEKKKVLERREALQICQKCFKETFSFNLFEENWRYLEGFFSIKV